ncbi:MAG: hypothetical protein QOK27_532, partial [Gemmatimonadales bacterium]|nr:hypothetical protein [Gemmatimonadales bacterium]
MKEVGVNVDEHPALPLIHDGQVQIG